MPRMPVSTSSTCGGELPARAGAATTSTPKPSSERNVLPMPATSTFTSAPPARRAGSSGTGRARSAARRPGRRRPRPRRARRRPHRAPPRARWPQAPSRNRSCTSPPRPGRSTTRLPFATGVVPTSTESVSGSTASSCSHHGGRSGGCSAGLSAPIGRSDRIAPCRRSRISGGIASTASMIPAARGSVARASAFSVVGQRERAQREDLVVLQPVEEVDRALRGELRVVVQDDRRRQQQVGRGRAARRAPARCARTCNRRRTAAAHRGGSVSRDPRPGLARRARCARRSATCAAPPRAAPPAGTRRR